MMSAARLRLMTISSRQAGTGAVAEVINPEECSAEEARVELRRVLGSAQFEASERNRRFLEYVVEETLAGRAERIKAYSIATIVFARGTNFDAQLDPVVRMEARRLRRSLERFYLTDGWNSSVRLAMPKGGYVPVFQHALTVQSDPNSLPARVLAKVSRLPGSSILVMPFDPEGGSSIFLNYSNGFTRQLLVGLSRFPELWVFGPTTVVGNNSKPSEEPQRDGPPFDFVLSGSTAVFDDVLNVKATLADAGTGKIIWGQTFEHELRPKGILSARDSIADCIVRTLAQPFGVMFVNGHGLAADKKAADLSGYECLTSFYRYRRLHRRDLFPAARECLEHVVMQDPSHAEAFACLSQIYTDGHRFGFAHDESVIRLRRQAADFAQRAVDLAPNSSRGHHAQGLAVWFQQEAVLSLEALQTALKLNPNATEVAADLGLHWSLLGDWDRGITLLQRVLEQDPSQADPGCVGISLYHFANGRFEMALAEARRIRSPHVTYGLVCKAVALVRLGRREEAAAAIARMPNINPLYGTGALLELSGGNLDAHLAAEIETALADAGLPMKAA
jgi:adenylate cyclase